MGERQHRVERVAPEHASALADLLGGSGYGCFCRYWHFQGDHRQWLARCAHAPEDNRGELLEAVAARSPEARGMVAFDEGGALIGWLKLAPAPLMDKLYGQRLYKGLPCFRERDPAGVVTVGCLYVREDRRRRGVARALLAAAIEAARTDGAAAVEAFPRSDTDVADAALMLGPLKLFLEAGFTIVNDFGPYPVLRRELAAERA